LRAHTHTRSAAIDVVVGFEFEFGSRQHKTTAARSGPRQALLNGSLRRALCRPLIAGSTAAAGHASTTASFSGYARLNPSQMGIVVGVDVIDVIPSTRWPQHLMVPPVRRTQPREGQPTDGTVPSVRLHEVAFEGGGDGGSGEGGGDGDGDKLGIWSGQLDDRYGGGPGLNSRVHSILAPKCTLALSPERCSPVGSSSLATSEKWWTKSK